MRIEEKSLECEKLEKELQSLQEELQQLHSDHIRYQDEYSVSCEEWKRKQMEVRA